MWIRRALLSLLLLFVAAALLNRFGQRSTASFAAAPSASLTVDAPEHLRGGLIFEGRFEINARTRISHPKLVLSSGWTEGMTLNSTSPQPIAEQSHGDLLTMAYPPVAAGQNFTVWTQWSVNPVNIGRRSQDVTLYDGAARLASVTREVTVFP